MNAVHGKAKHPFAAVVLIGLLTGMAQYEINIGPVISISVGKDFGMSQGMISFVTGLVALALAATIIGAGAFADRKGRRHILIVGLLIAIVGDILTVLSVNAAMFTVSRAIVGVGIACIYVCAFGLVREVAPTPEKVAPYLGLWIMFLYVFLLILQVFGGFVGSTNWRFAYVVPPILYLISIPLVRWLLPETPRANSTSMDYLGLGTLALGMLLTLYGVSQAGTAGDKPSTWISIALGVILLVVFYFIERGRENRAFPVEVFRNRYFMAALIAGIGFNFFESLFLIQTSMMWQYLFHYDPFIVTIGQLPVAVAVIATAAYFGRLMSRGVQIRTLLIFSFGIMAVAFFILIFTPLFAPFILFVVAGVLVGIGTSAAQASQAKLYIDQSPSKFYSASLASRTSVGQLGYSVGIALSSTILIASFNRTMASTFNADSGGDNQYETAEKLVKEYVNSGADPADAPGRSILHQAEVMFNDGFRLVMIVSFILALITIAVIYLLMRRPPKITPDGDPIDPEAVNPDSAAPGTDPGINPSEPEKEPAT